MLGTASLAGAGVGVPPEEPAVEGVAVVPGTAVAGDAVPESTGRFVVVSSTGPGTAAPGGNIGRSVGAPVEGVVVEGAADDGPGATVSGSRRMIVSDELDGDSERTVTGLPHSSSGTL